MKSFFLQKIVLFVCITLSISYPSYSQFVSGSIDGEQNVVSGTSYNYQAQGFIVSKPKWDVTNGTINSSSSSFVSITWNSGVSTGTVNYYDGWNLLASKSVNISSPPSPPTTTSGSRCGSGNVTLSASGAPSGGNYRWYDYSTSTSVLYTGSTFSPSVSSTRSYWVSIITSAGHESSRTSVTATIKTIPNVPSASNQSRCGAGQVTLTATGTSINGTYRWYGGASGGSVLATGGSYSPTVSATRYYYVSSYSSEGCESSRRTVTVTINPLPNAPSAPDVSRCGNGTVQLMASGAPSGGKYQWFPSSTSSTVLAETSIYTTPSLTSSTAYWVRSVSAQGCVSARTKVTAGIISYPGLPVSSNEERCGPGSLTLTASGAPTGSTYRWSKKSAPAIILATGSSYTVSSLSASEEYLVSAVNSAGCEGSATTVDAIIKPVPGMPAAPDKDRCGPGVVSLSASGAPSGGAYRWYGGASGGSVLATGSSYSPSVSATRDYYVSSYSSQGCESSRRRVTAIIDPLPNAPSAPDVSRCGDGTVQLMANGTPSGGKYQWFSSSTSSTVLAETSIYSTPTLTSSTDYWVRSVSGQGCVSAKVKVTAGIISYPASPVSVNEERCGPGTVTLTASGAPTGSTYNWYKKSAPAIVLATGSSMTISDLSASEEYLVSAVNSAGCEGSATTVNAIVQPVPGMPAAPDKDRCGPGIVSLSASGAPSGGNYRWYDEADGGSILATGSGYSPTMSATRDYYVSAVGSEGCEGSRRKVTVTIYPLPNAPSAPDVSRCGDGTVQLTASGMPSGGKFEWFSSATSSTVLAETSIYSTPALTSSTDYWVRSVSAQGCEGPKTKVTAGIISYPALPVSLNEERCGPGTITLTASGASTGDTYNWYKKSDPAIVLATGGSLTISDLSASEEYLVSAVNSAGCEGSATTVNAIVQPVPGMATAPDKNRCGPGVVSLSASGAPTGGDYRWYDEADGGPVLATGSGYSPTISATRDYYVSAVGSEGCEGPRLRLSAIVDASSDVPTIGGVARCGEGAVELNATGAPSGGKYEWFLTETSTSVVSEEPTYTTSALSGTTDFWVRTVGENGCGSERAKVTATVYDLNNLPAITAGMDAITSIPGKNATLSVEPVSAAINYNWYAGNVLVNKGLTYDVTVGSTRDFHVKAVLSEDGCESDPFKISQILWDNIYIFSDNGHYLPENGNITLGTNGSFDTYLWYKDGIEIATTQKLIVDTPGSYQLKVSFTTNQGPVSTYSANTFHVFPARDVSISENYNIRTTTVRTEGVMTLDDLKGLSPSEKHEQVRYYDGSGRVSQQIILHSSPNGNDIVGFNEYGDYSRQYKHYLPFVASTGESGSYREDVKALQASFYTTEGDGIADSEYPYSEVVYDNSPYGRIVEQGHVGEGWQISRDAEGNSTGAGHTIKSDQRFTTTADGAIRKWAGNGESTGTYAAGDLYVRMITDEEGKANYVFSNVLGQQVLKRSASGTETYYVYDDYGRLAYIISPKAVEEMAAANNYQASAYPELVFQFAYDNRSRLVERKVPGKGLEYIVYDQWNRALLSQNALMRENNQWQFAKYDKEHRPVMFGLYTNTIQTTREAMQQLVDGLDYGDGDQYYETRGTGTGLGYTTDLSFPQADIEIQSVNYYDDYDFSRDGSADYSYDNAQLAGAENAAYAKTRGMATGTKVKVLGSGTWLVSVYFYDEKGRIIQTQGNNIQNANVQDINTAVYDWEGKLLKSKALHTGAESVALLQEHVYDHAGRITEVWHQADQNEKQLIGAYSYNELGQLIEKNLHSEGAGFLQSVDLNYSIRGWLTGINNIGLTEENANNREDFFGMEISYEGGANGKYDGKITSISWNNAGETPASKYDYHYDGQNRLTAANYSELNGASTNAYDMSATYDANGNIAQLNRYSGGTHMDDLTYSYTGNQLMAVADAQIAEGFDDANTGGDDYGYDANGNLAADHNKGITSITYNHLDKPVVMVFADGSGIENYYTADGSRVKQAWYDAGHNLQKTTEYLGGIVYENQEIQLIGIPDGRLVKDVGQTGQWEYQYAHTDHLGNVRMLYTSKAKTTIFTATMERDSIFQEDDKLFLNMIDLQMDDHATSHSDVQRILPQTVKGAGISLPVYPGDTVEMSVQGFYRGGNGNPSINLDALVTAVAGIFGGTAGGSTTEQATYDLFDNNITSLNNTNTEFFDSNEDVAAYLNYIIFDKNFVESRSGFIPMDGDAYETPMLMSNSIVSPVEGFIYIYLTNESNAEAYFDDFTVTIKESAIVQNTDYYPFGLSHNTSWTRPTDLKNNYLYNAGSELNEMTKNYETFYRNYDPAIGRFNGVDIMAARYHSESPYSFAGNNPVYYNDPMGDRPQAFRDDSSAPIFLPGMAGGAWSSIGPGSGNHWTDQLFSNPTRDYFLMSGSAFDARYGAAGSQERADVAASMGTGGYLVNTNDATYIYTDKSFQADFAGGDGQENWYRAQDLGAHNGGSASNGGMTDFTNSSLAWTVGGATYGVMEGATANEGYWLGKNGKYYSQKWGGNQYAGSRAGALKAANGYKLAGRATVAVAAVVGVYSTREGYIQDGGEFGYNAQVAAANSVGGIAGGIVGAKGGALIGAGIGAWFGGVGAIPGGIIGGFIGGIAGSIGGGYAGEGAVNYYHGR